MYSGDPSCPVIRSPHPGLALKEKRRPSMLKKVLVAVDGSPHAQAATDYAAYLAVKFSAQLELLHVIDWRLLAGHLITHFEEVLRSEQAESFTERVKLYYR